MSIYSNKLSDLVERVCRVALHDWKSGTCTGGTTSTFIDTNRGEGDDYFNSTTPVSRVRIVTTTDSLAPIGEERNITDWVNSTTTGTVGVNFTVAPASGDTYAILSEFTWEEVRQAINLSIDKVAEIAMTWKVDTSSITTADDTYEYNLPTSFMYLYRVTQADANGAFDDQEPIPNDQWIIVHTSTPKLRLLRLSTEGEAEGHYIGDLWADQFFTASRALRLEGMATPALLTADTDLCSLSPDYIVWQAGAVLHASRSGQFHQDQAKYCQQQADKERVLVVPTRPPLGSKRIRE